MFVRSKLFARSVYIKTSKRLSNEFREVLNTRLNFPTDISGSQLQLAVNKDINAHNLDLYLNNLNQYENRQLNVIDLVANLRQSKLANTCLASTNFAVVRYLLENANVQEMVSVLLDRPKFGIFLNNFTGFAVIRTLYNKQEYILSLPITLKLVLLDEMDSIFIQGFCIKSCIKALRKELSAKISGEENVNKSTKSILKETKVRVKFLRNSLEHNINYQMGKAILKIASKVLEGHTKDNANILGYVLTENYVQLKKILNVASTEIYMDVFYMCKELLLLRNQLHFVNKIEDLASKNKTENSFENFIDILLAESVAKETISLAEQQKQLLPIWQRLREQKKVAMEDEIARKERVQNIKKIKKEIAAKKDLLWFFNQEDELDLEIHKKRIFYPKRWFGKKKAPRVVDEHYIPPQIRKIH